MKDKFNCMKSIILEENLKRASTFLKKSTVEAHKEHKLAVDDQLEDSEWGPLSHMTDKYGDRNIYKVVGITNEGDLVIRFHRGISAI
jgi:hypothetical protein